MNLVRNIKHPGRERISNGVKITIRNQQKKIPINPRRIKSSILKALAAEGAKISGDITVCFMDDKKMRQLNKRYHGRDSSTDVLAFDLRETPREPLSADIAVSSDTAVANARIFRTNPLYEIHLYVVHGVLHLLGYDDKNAGQRKAMNDRAEGILLSLGIDKDGGERTQ